MAVNVLRTGTSLHLRFTFTSTYYLREEYKDV